MVIPKKIPSKLDSCLSDVEFDGLEGLSINGQIKWSNPPAEGATVLLTSGGNVIDSMITNGEYKFGPMDPHKEYDISIQHNDYRFMKSHDDDNNFANFDAFELANVAIKVVGEDGKAMADVVVKLSGPKPGILINFIKFMNVVSDFANESL